ncbi:hypothetical protein GWO43_07885 [candidate division KSB1 bacterium]|nr:hypothetical protein [candidate division KSB1 bacterium]NIS23889.1 hypothetical protein [candidate division KSB1 bacterium]NIT70806.1 hypothetical protein [candidate division KSB1 bacterium]NIU24538.1 hypothetical protein [candidate division KSB1 bacterium]NIU94492.1 hypothetical protein [candidate division KSB1 bacterium]
MSTKNTVSRREFLSKISQTGFAAWLGIDMLITKVESVLPSTVAESAPAFTKRGIIQLRLNSGYLEKMRAFYAKTMGFKADLGQGTLRVKTGGTIIEFNQAEQSLQSSDVPYYHIAWAIPENKFRLAKAWLKERTQLLSHPDGRNEFHFRRANRHAVYFADPAGNILELIARHNLKDGAEGPFTLADILYVNHFGFVVDDVATAIGQIRKALHLGLRHEPYDNFATVGDEHRHIVFVSRKRLWLPEMSKPAEAFASEAVLHGTPERTMDFDRYPYRISLQA